VYELVRSNLHCLIQDTPCIANQTGVTVCKIVESVKLVHLISYWGGFCCDSKKTLANINYLCISL
jgi:hypothetical protein